MKTSNIIEELIINTEGRTLVSARELHKFLEVKTPFRKWIEKEFEYGFDEGIDYLRFYKKGQRKNASEYLLELECVWKISMMQSTEKGHQIRRYFIGCEKQLPFYTPILFLEAINFNTDLDELIRDK